MANINVNTTELLQLLDITPADHNIMLVGKHGIGKSEILTEYYAQKGMPVVALFLGQMSDPGDLIGIPNKNENTGKTDLRSIIRTAILEAVDESGIGLIGARNAAMANLKKRIGLGVRKRIRPDGSVEDQQQRYNDREKSMIEDTVRPNSPYNGFLFQ